MSAERAFNSLRQKLDALGYTQPLPLGAVALVGAIFEDLVKTTESLRDSKLRISELLEEKSCWELGVEPYKCDNSRLLAECNQLHMEVMQVKEDYEERICDYNLKIRNLESDKKYLEEHCKELEDRIKCSKDNEMRSAKTKKGPAIPMVKKPFISTVRDSGTQGSHPTLEASANKCPKCNSGISKTSNVPSSANVISLSRHSQEMERLQNNVKDLSDHASFYKKKIECRDREISRLSELLTGGRPPAALAKDCCYKDVGELSEDVENLQKDKTDIAGKLKHYQEKMHEAMQRSVELDERNKKLQKTLEDLKETALSVESRANSEIAEREAEINELKNEIADCKSKVDNLERSDCDRKMSKAIEEKRKMNERVNELTQKESEISLELDKCQRKYQKIKEKMNALQKENDDLNRKSMNNYQLDEERIRLKAERDFFQKEYLRLIAKASSDKEIEYLQCQLKLKDEEIKQLRSELCHRPPPTISHYQHPAMHFDKSSSTSDCVQAAVLRAERERDVIKAELGRVCCERDSLHEKLQCNSQVHVAEMQRCHEKIECLTARIGLLESDNRDLNSARIPGQSQIVLLKEEMADLKKELCLVQSENYQLKSSLNQLRILQEQTERSLVEYQNKCAVAETQLENAESKLSRLNSHRESSCNDINLLRNEIAALKATYVNIENEKDKIVTELDIKTERVYQLERELKSMKERNQELEKKVPDLRERLERQSRQSKDRESELFETSTESKSLRQQISTLKESRDKAIAENNRLTSQLADCQSEGVTQKRKLKDAEKEVERLRHQLKQYVKEVKKAEDLLALKERERDEMLEHYRSLSHDAVMLEGNNQSLENESVEHKRLLSEAECSIDRMKRDLCNKSDLIDQLETQVATLQAHNSSLERDLEQAYDEQRLLKIDLEARKELCDKLDLQKDKLDAELMELEEIRRKLERDNEKLRKNTESLNSGSQASIETLEGLLQQTRSDLEKQIKAQSKLTQELHKLKDNNSSLEKMLGEERERRKHQEALAKEFDVQNQELRHNITDDRFKQARSREQSPRQERIKKNLGKLFPMSISEIANGMGEEEKRDLMRDVKSIIENGRLMNDKKSKYQEKTLFFEHDNDIVVNRKRTYKDATYDGGRRNTSPNHKKSGIFKDRIIKTITNPRKSATQSMITVTSAATKKRRSVGSSPNIVREESNTVTIKEKSITNSNETVRVKEVRKVGTSKTTSGGLGMSKDDSWDDTFRMGRSIGGMLAQPQTWEESVGLAGDDYNQLNGIVISPYRSKSRARSPRQTAGSSPEKGRDARMRLITGQKEKIRNPVPESSLQDTSPSRRSTYRCTCSCTHQSDSEKQNSPTRKSKTDGAYSPRNSGGKVATKAVRKQDPRRVKVETNDSSARSKMEATRSSLIERSRNACFGKSNAGKNLGKKSNPNQPDKKSPIREGHWRIRVSPPPKQIPIQKSPHKPSARSVHIKESDIYLSGTDSYVDGAFLEVKSETSFKSTPSGYVQKTRSRIDFKLPNSSPIEKETYQSCSPISIQKVTSTPTVRQEPTTSSSSPSRGNLRIKMEPSHEANERNYIHILNESEDSLKRQSSYISLSDSEDTQRMRNIREEWRLHPKASVVETKQSISKFFDAKSSPCDFTVKDKTPQMTPAALSSRCNARIEKYSQVTPRDSILLVKNLANKSSLAKMTECRPTQTSTKLEHKFSQVTPPTTTSTQISCKPEIQVNKCTQVTPPEHKSSQVTPPTTSNAECSCKPAIPVNKCTQVTPPPTSNNSEITKKPTPPCSTRGTSVTPQSSDTPDTSSGEKYSNSSTDSNWQFAEVPKNMQSTPYPSPLQSITEADINYYLQETALCTDGKAINPRPLKVETHPRKEASPRGKKASPRGKEASPRVKKSYTFIGHLLETIRDGSSSTSKSGSPRSDDGIQQSVEYSKEKIKSPKTVEPKPEVKRSPSPSRRDISTRKVCRDAKYGIIKTRPPSPIKETSGNISSQSTNSHCTTSLPRKDVPKEEPSFGELKLQVAENQSYKLMESPALMGLETFEKSNANEKPLSSYNLPPPPKVFRLSVDNKIQPTSEYPEFTGCECMRPAYNRAIAIMQGRDYGSDPCVGRHSTTDGGNVEFKHCTCNTNTLERVLCDSQIEMVCTSTSGHHLLTMCDD